MAILQISFRSKTLKHLTDITAVVPLDTVPEMFPDVKPPFRLCILLHGYSGGHADWLNISPLGRLAARYNTVFVCPQGDNGFYFNDKVLDYSYEDFICREIPEFFTQLFPLSKKREDTIIGGLSMGGYGALYSGFLHPDIFGSVIALSPALVMAEVSGMTKDGTSGPVPFEYYDHIFGPLSEFKMSDKNLEVLARKIASVPQKPKIFMACGLEDFLLQTNRDFHQCLQKLEIPHTYEEGPGVHDIDFWREWLPKGLEYVRG